MAAAWRPIAIYETGNNRPEPLTQLTGSIEEACGRKAVVDMQPMQPGVCRKLTPV